MKDSVSPSDLALAKEFAQRLAQEIEPRLFTVTLFGSRARGEARAASDWDIGLLGPEPLPPAVVARIRGDLEDLPTLHRFDVVDLAAAPAGFRDAALRQSVPLV